MWLFEQLAYNLDSSNLGVFEMRFENHGTQSKASFLSKHYLILHKGTKYKNINEDSVYDVMKLILLAQVLMPLVGVVGVLGNLGAILILMRPEMKSTFHHSLITLAIVDIIFVITLIVDTQARVVLSTLKSYSA